MLRKEACQVIRERTGLLLQVPEDDLLGIGEGGAQDLVVEPVPAQRLERLHLGQSGRGDELVQKGLRGRHSPHSAVSWAEPAPGFRFVP